MRTEFAKNGCSVVKINKKDILPEIQASTDKLIKDLKMKTDAIKMPALKVPAASPASKRRRSDKGK